ncbi:MAG: energy transducer TonB [Erythrobacter sp.]
MGETATFDPPFRASFPREASFRKEERAGLIVAVTLHVGVVALLLLQPVSKSLVDIPERMTVSLASEVSLEATAPQIVPESRAAIAPTLSAEPAPVTENTPSLPASAAAIPTPQSPPPPSANRRITTPATTPPKPRTRPDRTATPTPPQAAKDSGGSRIGNDFLTGGGSSTSTDETRLPASEIGASAKASIVQAIARELKPHWTAPSGLDADRLVTILAFDLNEDGSLKGKPRVVSQAGINDSNKPQAALHAQRAIRAVQLAAPFDLPDEYYNAWKSIRGARFDRNLSQ